MLLVASRLEARSPRSHPSSRPGCPNPRVSRTEHRLQGLFKHQTYCFFFFGRWAVESRLLSETGWRMGEFRRWAPGVENWFFRWLYRPSPPLS